MAMAFVASSKQAVVPPASVAPLSLTITEAQRATLSALLPSRGTSSVALAAVSAACVCGVVRRGQRKQRQRHADVPKVQMWYTTQEILPSFVWLDANLKGGNLQPGGLEVRAVGGNDVCIGRTETGKLFAIGDKAPPTGLSFGFDAFVEGETIVDGQFGNRWNVFSGMPEGEWCPNPPVLGGIVSFVAGGRQAVALFEVRESFLSGNVEVQVDINAKKAYEAQYWKGVLDAQGKNDGTYY